MLEEYLLKHHLVELEEILDNADPSCYYSIYIKWVCYNCIYSSYDTKDTFLTASYRYSRIMRM